MTVPEVFERLAAIGQLKIERGIQKTYHFDIQGDGEWTLTLRDGRVTVARGRLGTSDVEISCEPGDFVELVQGRRAAVLIMQGRVQVNGGMEDLLHLRPVFLAAFGHDMTSGRQQEDARQ